MRCREARERVLARCDGPLGADAERELRAHLESCTRCERDARDSERLHALVAETPLDEPSAAFDWRLRLRLAKAERETSGPLFEPVAGRGSGRIEFWGAAAAAAVVVVAAGLYLLRPVARPAATQVTTRSAPVEISPVRQSPGSRITLVRDGAPIGPQQPIPYHFLLQPETPAPGRVDSVPVAPPPGR
jgi:hypothetical protein